MIRSSPLKILALVVLLLFATSALSADGDWNWQVSAAPDELVPDSIVNFTLSAPDSQILITIDANSSNAVLITWNATYSWYFPPATSDVQRSVAIPFGQTPQVNISLLNPSNESVFSQTPQFSQIATVYTIDISSVVTKEINFSHYIINSPIFV
jgi:hypothetical protein